MTGAAPAYTRQFNWFVEKGVRGSNPSNPAGYGLRIQGPGVVTFRHGNTSKTIIEGKWKARRDPGVLTFFCRLCAIEEEPFSSAPVKYIVQLFLFIAEWIKTVWSTYILQLYCNFILSLYVSQMQQLKYTLRKRWTRSLFYFQIA